MENAHRAVKGREKRMMRLAWHVSSSQLLPLNFLLLQQTILLAKQASYLLRPVTLGKNIVTPTGRHLTPLLPHSKVDSAKLWVLQAKTCVILVFSTLIKEEGGLALFPYSVF